MNIQDYIREACTEAIHDDPDDGVDLDEAGTQILVIKELVDSNSMNTIMQSARKRFDDIVSDDYHGADYGDEPYRLGEALGFSKEQIDNALVIGYIEITDELDEEE